MLRFILNVYLMLNSLIFILFNFNLFKFIANNLIRFWFIQIYFVFHILSNKDS